MFKEEKPDNFNPAFIIRKWLLPNHCHTKYPRAVFSSPLNSNLNQTSVRYPSITYDSRLAFADDVCLDEGCTP